MADDKELITSRNLIDTDIGPLRRVTGILASMPIEDKEYEQPDGTKRPSKQYVLNMADIEVKESTEAYHFPTYTTRPFTISNRKKSRHGVLMESFNDLVDKAMFSEEQLNPDNPNYIKPSERPDFKATCVSKRIGIVVADGEDGRPKSPMLYDGRAIDDTHPKGQDVPTPAWMIYSIDGIGEAGGSTDTPMEEAMKLLDGKTLAEFNAAALATDKIRNDKDLLQAIGMPETASTSFANTLIANGSFTKDDQQVHHRVPKEETPF